MKNWWRTDEGMMKSWWRFDEELMKNWWRADDKLMKNWWYSKSEFPKLPETANYLHFQPKNMPRSRKLSSVHCGFSHSPLNYIQPLNRNTFTSYIPKCMPSCQKILNLRTPNANFVGHNLCTFFANYFELKSRICQLFCLSNVCSQLVILTCFANAPQQVQQIKYFLFEQMDKQGREIVQK